LSSFDIHKIGEFEASGFILGNDTLIKEIKQVEAGTWIEYDIETNKIKQFIYFKYLPDYSCNENEDYLMKRLDSVLMNSFDRLIEYANGRTLVIPLSGGLDSRLIVSVLKRKNYKNVICFSYGKKGNKESLISKKIAEKLEYKWIFVEYTRRKWKHYFNSKMFKDYFFSGDNYCSLPHIQDFIAVDELKTKKIIPLDSIFVPGHTGDFISGGHIPRKYIEIEYYNYDLLVEDIIAKHFRVNKFNKLDISEQSDIKKRIGDILNIEDKEKLKNLKVSSFYEYFDWKERQAKFIVNSIRVYDFFDYQWYLPLWDYTLMHFWGNVLLKEKIHKKLYIEYMQYFVDCDNELFTMKRRKLEDKIKNKYLRTFLLILRNCKNEINVIIRPVRIYFNHPFQWYGMFSILKVLLKNKFQNINTFLTKYYIANMIKK
jgi:asparagine synthase (glutamine-hydrolysing)